MSFNIKFTTRGRNLHAKAQTGTILNFTKIVIGDGDTGGAPTDSYSNLINPLHTININKLKATGAGTAIVGGVFTNAGLSVFYFREIGLFAQDPDLGEILYCYGNARANAEYIPAGNGSAILERQLDIIAAVGNAANITAEIVSGIYAIKEDLESKADLISGKVPESQLPEMNYLTPTGNGKDITVTFTEASTEADISSGEKLSVMFGKILKKFKNIIDGTTSVGKAAKLATARTINGVAFDGSANITVADSTKAPTNHASTANTYGIGTAVNHGHVKVRHDFLGTATEGETVSSGKIKEIADGSIQDKPALLATIPVSLTTAIDLTNYLKNGSNAYDEYIFELSGSITAKNIDTANNNFFGLCIDNRAPIQAVGYNVMFSSYAAPNTTKTITYSKKIFRVKRSQLTEERTASFESYELFGGSSIHVVKSGTFSNANIYLRLICEVSNWNFSNSSLVLKIYGLNYKALS